ncbi:MAG: GNAT family N-acetyltransferase [Chloroflexi bacterium]|nr:GNAT family N-acetyltransferase [Chloroflexota bacterium]
MPRSENVALTSLTVDDLPTLAAWINDREQVLFNAPYKPVHEGQHKAWFESMQNRNDIVIFGIRLLKSNKLIGTCQLHSIDHIHRSAELQIRLGEVAERGHGYGTEAVRLLLDFAFKDLNLNRVYLHVFATNAAALRTYEKVGFACEGLLRQAAYIDSRYVDVVVMGILQEEHVT